MGGERGTGSNWGTCAEASRTSGGTVLDGLLAKYYQMTPTG